MTLYAEVVLPLPLDRSFTYIVPHSCQKKAREGSRVLVPFRQRNLTGFIVRLRKRRQAKSLQLKEIHEILDETPVFSPWFLAFTRKLADYHFSSWGEILQSSLPPSFSPKTETQQRITDEGVKAIEGREISFDERKVLGLLQKRAYSPLFLKRKTKIINLPTLLSRLEKKGLIITQKRIKRGQTRIEKAIPLGPTQLEMDFSLDKNSLQLAETIIQKSRKDGFSPFLLHGSQEKREAVYFYLIRKIFGKKQKVLFLVPEISLTRSLVGKFQKRVGEKGACLHSRLSEKKRAVEWRRIKEGDVELVLGPRSALLSPLSNVGLIIVDEEQEESYYQQESPAYDARKGAWFRAQQERCALVFGSAYPSVESYYKAKRRGYLLSLENGAEKRKVEIFDEKSEQELISRKLKDRIAQRLDNKDPILVFINRRGYASFLFCARCNYIPRCVHCDISLTYHKKDGKLVCHYCNYSIPEINRCPECGAKIIRKRGVGIEVIEEELRGIFPQSEVVSFNTDVIKTRREQENILSRFAKGKIDILLGTQLLAHQSDLPRVSLVIIFYPETTLTLSDFKAGQKTFQNLVQMMKFVPQDDQGEVIIQTYFPDHFSVRSAASDDYVSFFKQEIKFRRLMDYPPYSHMAEVLFRGENLRNLAQKSRQFSQQVIGLAEDIEVLGPALAPVAKMRGRSRIQLVLKARKRGLLAQALRESLEMVRFRPSILMWD
jgi:primosomal protein N' (replication factor Y)